MHEHETADERRHREEGQEDLPKEARVRDEDGIGQASQRGLGVRRRLRPLEPADENRVRTMTRTKIRTRIRRLFHPTAGPCPPYRNRLDARAAGRHPTPLMLTAAPRTAKPAPDWSGVGGLLSGARILSVPAEPAVSERKVSEVVSVESEWSLGEPGSAWFAAAGAPQPPASLKPASLKPASLKPASLKPASLKPAALKPASR